MALSPQWCRAVCSTAAPAQTEASKIYSKVTSVFLPVGLACTSAALWCLLELQIIFHLAKHKVCCSIVGKISHLLHVFLVMFSPLCPASINGADVFSSKLPYICQQFSIVMGSPAVFLKSTILSLAATKSITAKKKKKNCEKCKNLCIRYIFSEYWAILVFAPGNVAQGNKCHGMSIQSVSLEALESIIHFS